MRAYIDHVLALLPFEPEVHQRLGGPPCTYVGHPLVEQVHELRPNAEEARRRLAAPPVLLVLPGSRVGEIERLLGVFADAVALLRDRLGSLEVVVPTVPHLVEADPHRNGRMAAARRGSSSRPPTSRRRSASPGRRSRNPGTVTLELALAGVPMIAAYKVSRLEYLAVGRGS